MEFCVRCKKVLLAEDERTLRLPLASFLRSLGAEVVAVESGADAIAELKQQPFHLVLSDIVMPDADGLAVLATARELQPQCRVILMTAYASVDTAVSALRMGAFDYLVKPFPFDELETKLAPLCHRRQAETSVDGQFQLNEFVCCSPAMQGVLTAVQEIGPSDASVLVVGETGSGKEVIASAIHHFSKRSQGPIVRVNCAAIPESLFESEFFGYERGAFTGASQRRIGRFEAAHGGTLFLDEIGSLSPAGQAKLLRVLQNSQFERLGSSQSISVDIRVIAAAQDNLSALVQNGEFRQDLYFRLAVLVINVPPLRSRRQDILPLAQLFVDRIAKRQGRLPVHFSEPAARLLQNHEFVGNVRELHNTMERAMVLCTGREILEQHIRVVPLVAQSFSPQRPDTVVDSVLPLQDATARFEKDYIENALRQSDGNKTKAAETLGISRKTLWEKVRRPKDGE